MNSTKTTARIVGALFLIVMFTYSLGAFVILDPILNAPDYLLKVSANQARVITGVLLELINGIAYIGIAVLVYPIIKQLNESLGTNRGPNSINQCYVRYFRLKTSNGFRAYYGIE